MLRSLSFSQRPPYACGNRGLVIFALNHVLRAALVGTKDLVIQVQSICDEAEAVRRSDTALRVDLEVGVEVNVVCDPPASRSIALPGRDLHGFQALVTAYSSPSDVRAS